MRAAKRRKPKRGRPPMDPRKVQIAVSFRLNAEERELCEAAADLDGMRLAPWLRRAALMAAEPERAELLTEPTGATTGETDAD